MIIEYIRFKLKGGAGLSSPRPMDEFEAALRVAASSLDGCPYCLNYELSRCNEEPSQYVFRIEWDSLEGHLSGFRQSMQFAPFLQAIKPYIGAIEEMLHYELTSVVAADRKSEARRRRLVHQR